MSLEESGGRNPFERVDEPPATPTPDDEGFLGPSWDRRRFLTAAAVGTAAAAMYGGDSLFRPLAAYADNLSGLNCTANDVRIVGPGQIINEPCDCTGSFNAQVRFRVINNTGTTRYCVTVHFCPGTLPDGSVFDPGDILIGDIPKKSDAFYTVTIPNYPCGAGLVCFGACGTGTDPDTGLPDCSFAKGEACPTGECCTTISWDVNPGCPDRVLSSKCRHQQVCIQGRGRTTVDCDVSTTGNQTNCAVQCGATTTIRVCTTEAASFGPFVFTLTGGGTTQTFTGAGPCHDFTVGPITDTTTFTASVKSNDNCTKTATVTLTTTPITASIAVSGDTNCNGVLTLTASVPNGTGCTFTWSEGATTLGTGPTLTYGPVLDGLCHTIHVAAMCSGCPAAAEVKIRQCAATTLNCT
jgi:hypothetical protein